MTKTYRKTGTAQGVGIYQAEDGEKMILVPVNREYTQAKKPVYYLKRGVKNSKPEYLTGLFATEDPRTFSGDVKDPITGLKIMLKLAFNDGGESITIEGRRAW